MLSSMATRSGSPDKRRGALGARGVRDICASLGYKSNNRSEPRNYLTLRDKVVQYRKDYVEKLSKVLQTEVVFPTSYQAKVARECASDFLQDNQHLFRESSVPSQSLQRLIFPDDSQQILIDIAKMMCKQARKYNSSQPGKTNYHRSESQEIEFNNTPDDVDQHGSKQNVYRREYTNNKSSLPSRDRSTSTSIDHMAYNDVENKLRQADKPIDSEAVENFLDLIYPPNHPKIGTENKWLFTPRAPWPENLKPFAYRYVLEHTSIIVQRRGVELQAFVVALKTQTQILDKVLHDEWEDRILDKAHKFLSDWVRRWRGGQHSFFQEAGLENNGQVTMHPILHEAWMKRRQRWCARSRELSSYSSGRRASQISLNNGAKRSYDDTFSDIHIGISTDSESSKRVRIDGEGSGLRRVGEMAQRTHMGAVGRDSSFSPESSHRRPGHSSQTSAHVEDDGSQQASIELGTIVVDDSLSRLNKSFNGQNRVSSTPEDFARLLDSEPESLRANQQFFRYSPSLRPASPVQDQVREHHDRDQQSVRLSLAPAATSVPAAPFVPAAPPQSNPTPQAVDQTSQKPVLQLIAERGFGSLDVKNPITWQELRKDTLETFLARVLSRRLKHKKLESLLRVKLIQRWGEKETFVVDRSASEEQWQETKVTIKDNFVFASETQPSIQLFKIWISCDTVDEYDEDDEDGY